MGSPATTTPSRNILAAGTGTRLHRVLVCWLPRAGRHPSPGHPPSARTSPAPPAWPDITIQGTLSWRQGESINPSTCGRIRNQPRDLAQLTWAGREPSWQLCPSWHCRTQLSAPGASLCPWTREGNQTTGFDQASHCSEQGSSPGNWEYCANSPESQWEASCRIYYTLIRQQVDISLATTR